jgi:hypothetical protein
MNTYQVAWEMDVEAETPREAAEKARELLRDPDSEVHAYDVSLDDEHGWVVDLDEDTIHAQTKKV